MLVAGLILIGVGVVVIAGGARKAGQQSRRAGADPSEGEMAYSWQGGVSKATSAVVLGGWALVILGVVLTVIALV